MKNIVINAKDGIIELNEFDKKRLLIDDDSQHKFFNQFRDYTIKKIYYYSRQDRCKIIMKCGIQLFIQNYNKLKKKECFSEFNKKIKEYQLNKILNKFINKKFIIAGSLAASFIIINFPNEEAEQIIPSNNLQNDISINNSIVEEIKKPSKIEFDEIMIKEKSASEIVNYNLIEEETLDENIIDFSILKDFNIYEEYINFAANLYGVDYETALKEVKKNFHIFTTPGKENIGMYAAELDRMKDLKARGAIEGDLNVIGIFITIKDYAIDHLDLNNQTPIVSTKTVEEKEKDLIDIAKYVYGVNDQELLNCLLATHRLETGRGTSPAVINKNNFGGNMSPSSTPGNLVLNVYKTAEIGEESMVRNFLNCYGRCFYNEACDQNAPIPVFMSKMYCTHTPDDWAREITELQNENIEEDINKYLNNNEKTM